MAGKAVFRKVSAKFGAKAATAYLYGDGGKSAWDAGDLATVGKMDKIQKFFGHAGFSSKKQKISAVKTTKPSAKKEDDRVFKRSKFDVINTDGVKRKYNGFVDQYGQKYVAQPNGGLVKYGR